MLNNVRLPEALFITADLLAYGMVKRFREAGIRIPEDLAVVGFGDEIEPFFADLTTIRQPGIEKGVKAGELLMNAINTSTKDQENQFYIFEPELITRTSCGASLRTAINKSDLP